MNTSPRRAALAATVALGALAVAAAPSAAVDATTQITFDVPTSISISAPASLSLGALQTGAGSSSGSGGVDIEVSSSVGYHLDVTPLRPALPPGIQITAFAHRLTDGTYAAAPEGGVWSVVHLVGSSSPSGVELGGMQGPTAGPKIWHAGIFVAATSQATGTTYTIPLVFSATAL